MDTASVELLWIPLGAGGSGFVRFNGRIYERVAAAVQRRRPLQLYHTALRVRVRDSVFIVETMWPSPPGDPNSRGVVAQAPVFSSLLAGTRTFRYEVRCWLNGRLQDAQHAVDGPQRLSGEVAAAERLLALTPSVPPLTWGRDQSQAGEMWNSNSVISWLLARSGFTTDAIRPPLGGRAPGWDAGLRVAGVQP